MHSRYFFSLGILLILLVVNVHAQDNAHQQLSLSFAVILASLLGVLLLVFATLKYPFIPNSCIIIALGLLVGLIVRKATNGSINEAYIFAPESFFVIMLPPIIFDAGLTLHKGYFFRNLGSILIFAIIGTIISTFIIGFGLFAWGAPEDMNLTKSLMYGALISAIDPVATLAVFHSLDINHTLHMLVFGESVLNDAVSIVMYRVLEQFLQDEVAVGTIFTYIGEFFLIVLGSALIGLICGLISAVFFKHANLREYPALELSLFFVTMYLPYMVAEGIGWSGITSLLVYGILCSHYTYYSFSTTGQYATPHFFRVLAFVAETIVFLYLGFSVFIYHQDFNFQFTAASVVWCLLGRAFNIFPLSFLLNRFRSEKISLKNQIIMWFAGLRGAIAFVLSLEFPENGAIVITTTLLIVLLSVGVLGAGTLPLLKLIKVEGAGTAHHITTKTKQEKAKHKPSNIYSRFTAFDRRHLWSKLRAQHPHPNMTLNQIQHQLGDKMKDIWRIAGTGTEIESGLGQFHEVEDVVAVVNVEHANANEGLDSDSSSVEMEAFESNMDYFFKESDTHPIDVQKSIEVLRSRTPEPEATTTLEINVTDVVIRSTPHPNRLAMSGRIEDQDSSRTKEREEEEALVPKTPILGRIDSIHKSADSIPKSPLLPRQEKAESNVIAEDDKRDQNTENNENPQDQQPKGVISTPISFTEATEPPPND